MLQILPLVSTIVALFLSLFFLWGILLKLSPKFYNEWFGFYMNYIHSQIHYEPFKIPREYIFQDLDKIVSEDPELRKENAIRILEIGCGAGPNFTYYPNNCRLIAVDPNDAFEKYFRKNHQKFPNVILEKFIKARGEDLDHHIPDESIDTIVLHHVLCSVQDQEQVLKQCYRILVKGGTLRFLEHVGHSNPMKLLIQKLVSPIWEYIAKCSITRFTGDAIKCAGFSNLDIHYIDNIKTYFPMLISANVYGIAIK